jgi:hypothetical protein
MIEAAKIGKFELKNYIWRLIAVKTHNYENS